MFTVAPGLHTVLSYSRPESCGLLLGRGDVLYRAVPSQYSVHPPQWYRVTWRCVLQALFCAVRERLPQVAVYHIHAPGRAWSHEDSRHMLRGIPYVLFSGTYYEVFYKDSKMMTILSLLKGVKHGT